MDELEKDILDIVNIFTKANDDLINLIVLGLAIQYPTEEVHVKSMTSLLSDINKISNGLKSTIKGKAEGAVKNAYNAGYMNSMETAGKKGDIIYTDSQKQSLDKLITDTCDDLLQATQFMSEQAKRFVRVKTSEVMQLQQALRNGNKQLAYSIARRLEEGKLANDAYSQAFTGIVDKAGRRWNLGTYSEMVARTKVMQAHIKGTAEQGFELGYHLYIISSHNAIDACSKWEGIVISVGEDLGYPDYFDIAASNECFHPNCKHHITPISEGAVERMNARG